MTSTSPVVRLMRLMTHLNIGAMLGMAAWLIWSGWQVATSQLVIPRTEVFGRTESEPMRLVPADHRARAAGHCLPVADTAGPGAPASPISEGDL